MGRGRREPEDQRIYKVVIRELAETDITKIVKWYNLQAFGLGEKFIKSLRESILKLKTHPLAFGISFNDVRKMQLKTYPYLVFYQVKNYEVYVQTVVHAKRKPSYYKKEIGKRIK